jgi:exodeoxyribonuclease V gamma subunit
VNVTPICHYAAAMLRVVVAESLEPLAAELALSLSVPPTDPFTTELIAVPSDGMRSWLTARLSRTIGIVANVDLVGPAELIRRVRGEATDAIESPWTVDRLTWIVLAATRDGAPGPSPIIDAPQAHRIAERFERYGIYRPHMIQLWAAGRDVDASGRTLPEHQRWQSQLWRACRTRIGVPSQAERLDSDVADLQAATPGSRVPERVAIFGASRLPAAYVALLSALAEQTTVQVFVPAPSVALWQRTAAEIAVKPLTDRPLWSTPMARADDHTDRIARHPLLRSWGASSREAQLVLTANQPASEMNTTSTAQKGDDPHLLHRLQAALRADAELAPADDSTLPELAPDDDSIQIHACYGRPRQVEVLRDALLHLFARDSTLEPRDVAILTPDVSVFASLIESTFAADLPGVPTIPIRVADRSLRQSNPVLDAALALLDLIGGRSRAGELLAFVSLDPVRRRFDLDDEQVGLIASWVDELSVRWGLDPDDRARFGIPLDLTAHTWQAALDRLLIGATMADLGPRFALDSAVPFGDVEGDEVKTAGALADLVHRLRSALDRMHEAQPITSWCDLFGEAMGSLCAVDDVDDWQMQGVLRSLDQLTTAAMLDGSPCDVPIDSQSFVEVLRGVLAGHSARARHGSGAVTVSSLATLRGVPHRVVCLLGLDNDLLGVSAGNAADDLIGSWPCLGDPDPRAELRAELLDAVLAADDHLIITRTGRDLRANREVEVAVPLAELMEVVDRTVPASSMITRQHPRQAYALVNLGAGGTNPWTFDREALGAARARLQAHAPGRFLSGPLEPLVEPFVSLGRILELLRHPTRFFLQRRLDVSLPRTHEEPPDLLPLKLDALDRWKIANELLVLRRAGRDLSQWNAIARATGMVPPGVLGTDALETAEALVRALAEKAESLGVQLQADGRLAVDHPLANDRFLTGELTSISGTTLLYVTVSRLKRLDELMAWARLAAATVMRPDVDWRAVAIGKHGDKTAASFVLTLTEPRLETARRIVDLLVDLHDRASCSPIPFHPDTSFALLVSEAEARKAWHNDRAGSESSDQHRRLVYSRSSLDALLTETRQADEHDTSWGDHPSRMHAYATRIWGTYFQTVVSECAISDDDSDDECQAADDCG